jgi:DNA/RNA-binding domain of Phe-tRNA-synthetase-like protein
LKLTVDPQVLEMGIEARLALVRNARISNKSQPLEKLKKEVIEALQSVDADNAPVLQEYRALHRAAGLPPESVPPAEHLIRLAQRNGRLPNINTVVDCYNLVSAQTFLSIGAHDLAHVRGDVRFVVTNGSELYVPLGETEPVAVQPGEYACMDTEKIICRMDIKQCQQTRITKDTTAFLVYVQGNRAVPPAALDAGLLQVCRLLEEICSASYEVVPVISR